MTDHGDGKQLTANFEQSQPSVLASNQFSLKDGLIAIPVFGSGLAICWEIGSFAAIGENAYSLFSTAEHIGFALQIVPIVGPMVAFFPIFFFFWDWVSEKLKSRTSTIAPRVRRSHRVAPAWMLGVSLVFLVSGILRHSALSLCTGVFSAGAVVLFALSPPRKQFLASLFLLGICFALATAFCLGFDATRDTLKFGISDSELYVDNDAPRRVMILRSGERGLLFLDTASKRVEFRRWEAIKSVNWQRISFYEQFRQIIKRRP